MMVPMADDAVSANPSLHRELEAMMVMVEVLAPLDLSARRRVLVWVADYFELALPGADGEHAGPDADELQRFAADWASAAVLSLDPAEVEQSCLDAQGWGDEQTMVASALREIARRLRIIGGTASKADLAL